MHIIYEAVYQKLLKLVHVCRNYSLPKMANFFETQCSFIVTD